MTLIYFGENGVQSDEFILAAYSAYCALTDTEMRVSVDRTKEKPRFISSDGNHIDVFFSLSHSGKFIACAISECDLGFDLQEEIIVDYPTISERLFNKRITEKKEFYRAFCAGEARKKLTEEGFIKSMQAEFPKAVFIDFFHGYTCAVCGGSGGIFLQEAR